MNTHPIRVDRSYRWDFGSALTNPTDMNGSPLVSTVHIGGIFFHRGAVLLPVSRYYSTGERRTPMVRRRIEMRTYRDVLRLHFELGKSYALIAEINGLSSGGVHNILQRFESSGLSWPLP